MDNTNDIPNEEQSSRLQQPAVGGTLTPFRCPVCGGNGIVAGGFYGQTSGQWLSAEVYSEECRSCKGTGVVWG